MSETIIGIKKMIHVTGYHLSKGYTGESEGRLLEELENLGFKISFEQDGLVSYSSEDFKNHHKRSFIFVNNADRIDNIMHTAEFPG